MFNIVRADLSVRLLAVAKPDSCSKDFRPIFCTIELVFAANLINMRMRTK